MSGDFYQVQAVPCSTVGSSYDSALCVLMMHHPRHYMTHSSVHNVHSKASAPAHRRHLSPETSPLTAYMMQRGRPLLSEEEML